MGFSEVMIEQEEDITLEHFYYRVGYTQVYDASMNVDFVPAFDNILRIFDGPEKGYYWLPLVTTDYYFKKVRGFNEVHTSSE